MIGVATGRMKFVESFIYILLFLFVYLAQQPPPPPQWVMASSLLRFLDHTQRRTIVGRTPLDEWSACRRDLYLTTHKIHNRQTSMSSVGFEHTISAGERPQTYALVRAATVTGMYMHLIFQILLRKKQKTFFLINKRIIKEHYSELKRKWSLCNTISSQCLAVSYIWAQMLGFPVVLCRVALQKKMVPSFH